MRVALITPLTLGPDSNPGWYMITAGIKSLVRKAVAEAEFITVDMMQDNAVHWAAAATCDTAILCGNPRFTLSDAAWWEGGIWLRLMALQAAGVRVIDGWAGSAYSLGEVSVDVMAQAIASHPRNAEYLKYAKAIHARITRDDLMTKIYGLVNADCKQLPCSSYWARDEMPVGTLQRKYDAIMLVPMYNRPRAKEVLVEIRNRMNRHLPTRMIASTWEDYVWARGEGFADVRLINDAHSLLRLYSRCDHVLAYRVHAAIPAASVGCKVRMVAIDTRATACNEFDIPVTPWNELEERPLIFESCTPPDEGFVVHTLKEMICR